MIKENAKLWFKERFPIDYDKFIEINEKLFIKEPIPVHMKKWFYCMGATPLVLFLLQILTGVMLLFYYIASPELAYESIRHLTEDVTMGFWIRGMHRWGSNLMIIALILHMVRVFFTRSYQKPRELNWFLGVILFILVLTFSFTGYSLINNQLSYWATTVGTNLFKEIPLIGNLILGFFRGGEDVTANILTRFFTLHVGILPLITVIFVGMHIIILRVHGVSEPEGYPSGQYAFYPHHFYKIVIASLFILCVLSALTVISPPGLGTPASAAVTPSHIKPEWYFFPVFRILKLMPLKLGIFTVFLFAMCFIFWPLIEVYLSKEESTREKISMAVGVTVILITIILIVWETVAI